MSTATHTTLLPSNTTAPLFRAWVQWVHDQFAAAGWINTADTGQMDIPTASNPTATNQKIGYKIYRMNDALQATAPVFVKIEFGGRGTSGAVPAMWVSVGQGSDGAGALTNVRFDGVNTNNAADPTVGSGISSASSTNMTSFASGSTSRISIVLFTQTSTNYDYVMVLCIERARDVDGVLIGTAVIMQYTEQATGINGITGSRFILLAAGGQPPIEKGLHYILSFSNPSAFGGDVGIGIPIPMKGVAQPPGIGVIVVKSSDFTDEAQFSVTIYGVAHTYQRCRSSTTGRQTSTSPNFTQDASTRIAILWE